jgi:hypothetical protein
MITLTSFIIMLYSLTLSSCIKLDMKKNISPDYKENFARFAESLYSNGKGSVLIN